MPGCELKKKRRSRDVRVVWRLLFIRRRRVRRSETILEEGSFLFVFLFSNDSTVAGNKWRNREQSLRGFVAVTVVAVMARKGCRGECKGLKKRNNDSSFSFSFFIFVATQSESMYSLFLFLYFSVAESGE